MFWCRGRKAARHPVTRVLDVFGTPRPRHVLPSLFPSIPAGHVAPTLVSLMSFRLHLNAGSVPGLRYQGNGRLVVMLCLDATPHVVFSPCLYIVCCHACQHAAPSTLAARSPLAAPFYTSRSVPKHGNACMAYLVVLVISRLSPSCPSVG